MISFFVKSSTIIIIGHKKRKIIEKKTLGFNNNASTISQWRNLIVALVIPHPGHGI